MGKRSCLSLVVLIFSCACLLPAQETRGSIVGTVTDPQGAVIPGATVAVTNLAMNTTVRLTTSAGGYYEALLLLPGRYSVSVEAPGFRRAVRSGLTLGLGEQLRVDISLELGPVTETVTVTGEASILDTSTVTTGRVITNKEIMDLPVLANNTIMLTRYTPGVQVPGTTQWLVQGQVGGGSQYYVPGNIGGNEWSLDGVSINLPLAFSRRIQVSAGIVSFKQLGGQVRDGAASVARL